MDMIIPSGVALMDLIFQSCDCFGVMLLMGVFNNNIVVAVNLSIYFDVCVLDSLLVISV